MHDLEQQRRLKVELREELSKALPDYMIPSIFVFMEAFPIAPTGKINRKALPKPETYEHETLGTIIPPRNPTEASIFSLWHDIIGIPHISMDDNFFDLGGNSLLAIHIYKRLEELYPGKIKLIDLFTDPTIEALAKKLAPAEVGTIEKKENPWIIELPGELPTRARLVCFAFAGGGTSTYVQWRKYLPPDISLCMIRLPGRESRLHETPLTDYEMVVEAIIHSLQPYLDKPYFFFGHSFGSRLCYDVASELCKRNAPIPQKIFLSGMICPDRLSRILSTQEQQQLLEMNDVDYLKAVSNKLSAVDEEVQQNAELLKCVMPALRADMAMMWKISLQPLEKACFPMILLYNQEDDEVVEGLSRLKQQLGTSPEVHSFPGNHFALQHHPKEYAEFVGKLIK